MYRRAAGAWHGRAVRLTGSMTAPLDDHLARILAAPVFGHLATVRPHGSVQVNPMWFEFDGEAGVIRFTHTTTRAKFRNLQKNPHMTLEALDPDRPQKYVEVRGRLAEVIPDPEGAFYVHLARRYGESGAQAPADKADRVILVMQVEKITGR
jgi:PPOX class probable F420-dependent enzyme